MFTKTFFKLFPPPKFLDIPYAGIDITDDAIRCIEYSSWRHGNHIHRFGSRALSPGIVDSGNIKDEKALTEAIASLAKEMKISIVKASLPEERMYLFKTDVPTTDEHQIRQNIEFKLEENVPLSPTDAVFFFDIIPAGQARSGKLSVSVSVAPRDLVNTYLKVFQAAGLSVVSFEIQAKALARAAVLHDSSDTQMIIHIMNKKTGLYVVCGGVVCFTSTISWGGGLIKNKQLQDATDDIFSLRREIERVYSYWADHGEGRPITTIILSGQDSIEISKIPHISPSQNLQIEIAQVWRNAFSSDHYIPPIPFEDSLDYAVAAGLALP